MIIIKEKMPKRKLRQGRSIIYLLKVLKGRFNRAKVRRNKQK